MKRNINEYLPVILNSVTGVGVLLISFLVKFHFSMPKGIAKLLGAVITMRSWPGLICVLVLFLPTEIYRAKLEEKALTHKFGSEWENYAARTGFFLPFIGKR